MFQTGAIIGSSNGSKVEKMEFLWVMGKVTEMDYDNYHGLMESSLINCRVSI